MKTKPGVISETHKNLKTYIQNNWEKDAEEVTHEDSEDRTLHS
jgi:hypothetical protein